MKVILLIILVIAGLFLFGEFILDLLIGAFTILAGAAGVCAAAVIRRIRRLLS